MSTIMITGGSRGIGAACVRQFSRPGNRVYFLYEKNHAAAHAVARDTGATAICCDVSDEQAVARAFERLPSLDILICNAGISHYGLVNDLSGDQLRRLLDVNVAGMLHCVRASIGLFLRAHNGSIVTVSSMWGQVGASCEVAYSASKGAVIAMTKALAKELGPSGVRVNCVAPGVILTDMCAPLGAETLAELAGQTPLGRNGTPEDVAQAIERLSGCEFVTGQVLSVSGGFVM
ncbi:MAG: SDR family oxidoreductase [Firmicutes bacterium]|nr:SDR family oxidoreductase [Bacillota bacterium]